jgi:fucose permease
VATFLVHGLLFASWTAHIPSIKAHLGISNGQLGLALLGAPVGSVAAMAVAAALVPRVGSRALVRAALVGYAAAGVIVGLAGNLPMLFLGLLLWGAFQGTLDISMNAQAIAVERAYERPLMNGMHGWWSIGAFAGAGAGTLGVAVGLGLAPQLVAIGVPTTVIALLLTTRMVTDHRDKQSAAHERAPRGRHIVSTAMLLLGAVAFASMLCEGAAADWSSVYLRDSVSGSVAVAGLGYTMFAFAMVLVRFAGNHLLTRFGASRTLPVLAVLAAASVAVALAVGTVAAGLIGFFLLGIGVGTVIPTAFSAAGRLPGLHPGQAVAGVSAVGWAGFLFGPPIIGQLADATSLPLALGLIPLLCVLIALAAVRVPAMRD